MTNELWYFGIVIIDLALALLAFRSGRPMLIAFIVTNLLLVTVFAGKVVSVFGFATTVAGPFYAAIFLATDALTEKWGEKAGYRSVWIGFCSLGVFVLLGQLSLFIEPVEFSQNLHDSMKSVFDTSLRIFIASIIGYVVSQNLDVWLFHKISEVTGGKFLWLRNNLSTIVSQFVDSILFFSIAFYGVLPNWFEVAIVGYVAKLLIALLDTPFLYLTKKIGTKDLTI